MRFEEIQEILKNKKVGIAGCGGLGSNCAVALARVGVGELVVADFDIIEESNLNRQYFFYDQIGQKKAFCLKENIALINPHIIVNAFDKKLNDLDIGHLYKDCDVIVEAFDKAEMKQMMIEAMDEYLPHIPLVIGLGMAGWGHSNAIHFRQVDQLYICGDEKSEVSEEDPPLAPRVAMVANMQANTVLDILLKKD